MTQAYEVEVRQTIRVTVDETKFTTEFMEEFRQMMFPYETIAEHVEYLAQLYARGVYDNGDFIEGYGPASEFGIKFEKIDGSEEVVPSEAVS